MNFNEYDELATPVYTAEKSCREIECGIGDRVSENDIYRGISHLVLVIGRRYSGKEDEFV